MSLLTRTYSAGTFKQPLFTADGVTCNGVEAVDGTRYYADKVVMATGAWSPTLIDLEGQCVSKVSAEHVICQCVSIASFFSFLRKKPAADSLLKAWVFAHLQLTPREAAAYKDVPVAYDGDYGFFFEPNE